MPQPIHRRLPLWLRLTLILGLALITGAGALGTYRYLARGLTLTIAASDEGQIIQILNALATRMAESRKHLRLKVVPTASMAEAADLFEHGKVDLAVLRADIGNQGHARAVVVAAQAVVLVLLPHGSPVEDFDGLKGKRIGVLDAATNEHIVGAIAESYGFDRSRFVGVTHDEAQALLRSRKIQALLTVAPLSERALAALRSRFDLKSKLRPGLLAIDQAAAIASNARYLETHELPKGTLSGSPPLPDDDLTTLLVPVNIVAQSSLSDDVVTTLTRIFIESRGDLSGRFAILSQIRAPETEKDAYIPLHPGAAAYYEGEEKTFFDRYGDALFYGPMALGALASLLAGIWKFLDFGPASAKGDPVLALVGLFPRVRAAPDLASLDALEDEIDAIVEAELSVPGGENPESRSDLGLAVSRLERIVLRRRAALEAGAPGAAASEGRPAASDSRPADRLPA